MGIADNACFVLSLKQNMNFTITTSVITVDVTTAQLKYTLIQFLTVESFRSQQACLSSTRSK